MPRKTYKYRTKRKCSDGSIYYINANSQAEVERKFEERNKQIEAGLNIAGGKQTVDTWANECNEDRCEDVSRGQAQGIQYRYNKHIKPEIGSKRLVDVTLQDCERILKRMATNGYSHEMIKKVRQDICFLFEQAVIRSYIVHDPTHYLKKIKVKGKEARKRRSITDEERGWFIKAADKDHRYVFFLAMLYTGCRNAEVAELKASDIITRDEVHLFHIRGTKTENADRYVPIPNVLYDRLPEKKGDEYLFTTVQRGGKSAPHKLNKCDMDNLWKSCKRDLNYAAECKSHRNHPIGPFFVPDDLTPYCLRHTYATDFMKQGYSYDDRTYLLGHSSIETTMDVYTHMDMTQAVEAAKKYDSANWK